MTMAAVTQIVGTPVIDQEHPPIGYDLHYVIKISFPNATQTSKTFHP